MTSKAQNEIGFRRLIRLKRVVAHAADLLEADAKALFDCSTVDGEWGDELDAKSDYEDKIETARQLRALM